MSRLFPGNVNCTLINIPLSESAVRTEDEVLQIHRESKIQSQVLTLFEDYFTSNNPQDTSGHFKPSRSLQIWFGDTYRDGFSDEYLALRDKLSDAAYSGDFAEVFQVLQVAEERFGESWINAPRLSKEDVSRTPEYG